MVVANICSRLLPVLQALYPLDLALPFAGLMPILEELVSLHRDLKTEIDIYVPFFRAKGSAIGFYDYMRSPQTGSIFMCTFPGMSRRFWDAQRQGWFEMLLTPAVVNLDSVLTQS